MTHFLVRIGGWSTRVNRRRNIGAIGKNLVRATQEGKNLKKKKGITRVPQKAGKGGGIPLLSVVE